MSAIQASKRVLRKTIAQALNRLPQSQINDESTQVCDQVMSMDSYKKSKHISIYISMEKELQTGNLLDDAFRNGKCVYVPRCNGDIMEMVKLSGRDDLLSLPKNRWGIPEPKPDREAADSNSIDFIVVPGVAFDRNGNRCGHGKGYYDRFVKGSTMVKCAVCLSDQVVTDVPHDGFDVKPDFIVSPGGILFSKADSNEAE